MIRKPPYCTTSLLLAVFLWIWFSGMTAALEKPSPAQLPRWRGFNLCEMFNVDRPGSGFFHEEDFRLIAALGFNFVRLPLDYRFWIEDGDWEHIAEDAFAPLDQALAYGDRYGIHVCMNFHRAPGYTVARPPEPLSLWKDAEALRICALHWRYFARRYKDIPNERLSFNLLNEPDDVDGSVYASVAATLVTSIREEDPDRLIIADGLRWGTRPCQALIALDVAQAARGYQPFNLTHYQAGWVSGSDRWPVPEWPARVTRGGFLYGPEKAAIATPLRVEFDLEMPASFTITIGEVSTRSCLHIVRDEELLHEEWFTTGPGEGPWQTSRYRTEWDIYQCTYDKDSILTLPAGRYALEMTVPEGDWLTVTKLAITRNETELDTLLFIPEYGEPNATLSFKDTEKRFNTGHTQDKTWLWEDGFKDWAALREAGVGVVVGEWGAYNKTTHAVTLRWMEDMLRTFQRAGMGWALWNFRGAFGILDSDREDVTYEDFEGHRLDRKMLELLQRY